MAGRKLTVQMGAQNQVPAWQTVAELSATKAGLSLTLVGGLMVAAHAARAGVTMRRPTDDVDVLVDYATNRGSLSEANQALRSLGFELSDRELYAYLFRHPDGRTVDLMVADHLPSRMAPRIARRPAFPVPAGEQAIRRRDLYKLAFGNSVTAVVGVPDELGALVAKGAAWITDSRDRNRHLDDCAVLLACVNDASALDYGSMNKNDRRRIRAVLAQLADPARASWANLDPIDRERGALSVTLIGQGLRLFG